LLGGADGSIVRLFRLPLSTCLLSCCNLRLMLKFSEETASCHAAFPLGIEAERESKIDRAAALPAASAVPSCVAV
jgi:hypothetical protein